MRDPHRVKIIGTGRCLPERIVTNEELSQSLDTSDEWIRQRTGIGQRHRVGENDSTCSLAVGAGKQALERAGVAAEDIDLLICATVTPDYRLPFTAALVQRELGIPEVNAFDLTSGCAGFVQAFQTVSAYLSSGLATKALVIGVDVMSSIINPEDRRTAVLFGDGAGAMVLVPTPEGESSGLYGASAGAAGDDEVLVIPGGGTRHPLTAESIEAKDQFVVMKGRDVFRFAVEKFSTQIQESCRQAGIEPAELRLVVPHQVNQRILDAATRRCGIDSERVYINLDRYANCAGASVPIAFDEALEKGEVERGDAVCLVAFGSGLAWASALFRY